MSRRDLAFAFAFAFAGGLSLGPGCLAVPSTFHCDRTEQCVRSGTRGTCEPTGWCSLPDATCPSGRRYASAAGDSLGDTCVPLPSGACGMPGQPCCAGNSCSSALYECISGSCSARPCVDGITAGGKFSCAHRVDGTLWCWGDNTVAQLGRGTEGDKDPIPARVTTTDGGKPIAALENVFAGQEYACAHDAGTHYVYCWGRNESGQLGNGTLISTKRPTEVLGAAGGIPFTNAVGLTVGGHHACIWDKDGGLSCWGDNQFGQLGQGTTVNDEVKLRVPQAVMNTNSTFFKYATVVAVGAGHTCAAQSDDSVWCWGHNDFGQLGSGSSDNLKEPYPVPVMSDANNRLPKVISLGAGESHTCAVRAADQSVWCWGAGADGRLGDGTTVPSSPLPVMALAPGPGSSTLVAAGGRHTCALGKDRKVRCWGANNVGQLGNGMPGIDSAIPIGVNGLVDAVDLAVGPNHACAVRKDGTVWCWGANDKWQLGNTDGMFSSTPVQVKINCMP